MQPSGKIQISSIFCLTMLFFTVLWAAAWAYFPLSLDPYYHLFISRQMIEANGPIGYEWWEFAPVGRPHLYPPVLHLFLSMGLKAGLGPIFVLRLASLLLIPLVFVSIYNLVRLFAGEESALASLWAAMIPVSFALHGTITLAASLAIIEMSLCVMAIEKNRPIAAGLLLGLMFYTHLGLPWVFLVSLVCYLLFNPGLVKVALKASFGILLAIPWFFHLALNARFFQIVSRYENQALELNLGLCFFALIGIIVSFMRRGKYGLFAALLIGFIPFAFKFSYRWVSGEGLFPVIILCGIGMREASIYLSKFFEKNKHSFWRKQKPLFLMMLLWVFALCMPSIALTLPTKEGQIKTAGPNFKFITLDSLVFRMLNNNADLPRDFESSFYSKQTQELSETVASLTKEREIIWSNAPYALGLIASIAKRPMSSAMFSEVRASRDFDQIGAAKLLVWFKFEPISDMPSLDSILRAYRLNLVGENELAFFFINPEDATVARKPQAFLPFWAAYVILFTLIGFIVYDFRKRPGALVVSS
jgi:hypothetical protein